jgi:barstar (barnase inhibitor)
MMQKFALVCEDKAIRIAEFNSLEGFFVGRRDSYDDFEDSLEEWPAPLTLRVDQVMRVDRDFEEDLRRHEEPHPLGNMELHVLGDSGNSIGSYWIGDVTIERWRLTETGLRESIYSGWVTVHPDADAARVWDTWRHGPPDAINLWAQLPVGRREGWLEVVSLYRPRNPGAGNLNPGRKVVSLDGRYITDLASFFCAIGEAANGPGGYFGSNLIALAECARGGFGVDPRFTLRWSRADVAQRYLARMAGTADGPRSYMELIQSVLADERVNVILELGAFHDFVHQTAFLLPSIKESSCRYQRETIQIMPSGPPTAGPCWPAPSPGWWSPSARAPL